MRSPLSILGLPARLALFFVLTSTLPVGDYADSAPDPLQHHYSAAQTFQLAGDFDRAEAEYHQVLPVALQRMGTIAAESGDLKGASRLLQESVAADPGFLDAHADLALIYYRTGHVDKAAAEAAEVVKTDPRNGPALQLLGSIEFAQNNFTAAEKHLRTALGIQGNFDTAYMLALTYLSQHKLAETKLLFDELLNDMGSTPPLHAVLGRAYRETGYTDEAIRQFKKAIDLDPHYPRVHYYLALAYLAQGEKERFSTAETLFQQELAINHKEFFSTFFLGVIYLEDRDFVSAEEYLKKAVQLQPQNPDPLLYLGQVYFENKNPDLAIETLKKSIALTTDLSRNNYQVSKAHSMIGQILVKVGKQQEAEVELDRSQELRALAFQEDKTAHDVRQTGQHDVLPELKNGDEKPSFLQDRPPLSAVEKKRAEEAKAVLSEVLANAYNNLGVIQARQGKYAEATDYFSKAAQWEPDLPGLDRNWGLASFHAKKFEDAIGPLAREVALSPDDTKAREALGLSYFAADNFSKTAEVLKPELASLPSDPGVLYALAASLARTGDSATAAKLFRQLLESNPNVAEIHVVLGEAYADQNQYTPAVAEFSRALQLDANAEGAHFGWGILLLHEGKVDDAVWQFRAEVDAHPQDVKAKYHLAYGLLLQQHRDEALTLLLDVTREKPDYAEAHYQLGKLLLERGEVKPAIERLETAVRLDPTKDYSNFQLSQAYRRDGRIEDAQRVLQAYKELKAKQRGTEQP